MTLSAYLCVCVWEEQVYNIYVHVISGESKADSRRREGGFLVTPDVV